MRDEAFKRIGHLYPPVEVTPEMAADRPDLKPYVGEKLTVIAWLWARTVKSPNPAYSHVDVPLASTFILSSKEGKEAYVHPVKENGSYRFMVKVGKPPSEAKEGTKAARGNFRCLVSQSPINGEYLRDEAQAGRMGQKLMAIVAEGDKGRVYLSPIPEQENVATSALPKWKPEVAFFQQALGFRVGNYGMTKWGDLFSSRQLVALTTFSDLVSKAAGQVLVDAGEAGVPDKPQGLREGGSGITAYAEALAVYLALNVSKSADYWSNLCIWRSDPKNLGIGHVFARQAISMTWDYAEGNPFSESSGSWLVSLDWMARVVHALSLKSNSAAYQADAVKTHTSRGDFISMDPPYYDNIGYADLSDFFYVWLRPSLRSIFPSLLGTISTPKEEELVATPARHGGKQQAEQFFHDGMTQVMRNVAVDAHCSAPVTIYYAFKQSETVGGQGTTNTGWDTFLAAIINSGLSLTGTWPIRTEMGNRTRGMDSNALASSIVLVCRPRLTNAGTIDRRKFQRLLNEALPLALDAMTRESEGLHSPVAPVDLSQAIIGPGMAIFSRYDAVLEADGTPMTVRTALQLINRFLAEDDFDADTQFCLHWFEQHAWEAGKFGEADTLARAKGTSVDGVKVAGVVAAAGGVVRLLRWKEYPADWDPATDARLPVWEALHQLIRAYSANGDAGAARVLAGVGGKAEAARQLAYRLYTLCERRGMAEDARAYNEVVTGWGGIESAAAQVAPATTGSLFDSVE